MSEKKQGAAEWLRGIVDWYEADGDIDCSDMAKRFGNECSRMKSCRNCMIKMMTAIADRIDAERALPEGMEWPRFEDGELVKVGDTVGSDEPFTAKEIAFESERWLIKASSRSAFGCFHDAFGERVKRPTPKVLDADGAPIEVGDTVYLRSNGREGKVVGFYEDKGETWVGETWVSVSYELGSDRMTVNTEGKALTHERPDSWERIASDMEDFAVDNEINGGHEVFDRAMDFVDRIRKLAEKEG